MRGGGEIPQCKEGGGVRGGVGGDPPVGGYPPTMHYTTIL